VAVCACVRVWVYVSMYGWMCVHVYVGMRACVHVCGCM